MANCKECYHTEVCSKHNRMVQIDEHTWDEYEQLDDVEKFCEHYKSTADVVEAKWISVDDKLPEEDARVLVAVAHSTRIDTDRRIDGMCVRWGKYVTHWQALPELPRTPKERGVDNG